MRSKRKKKPLITASEFFGLMIAVINLIASIIALIAATR